MGVYDMLPEGSQVKLWDCDGKVKKKGDNVPDFGLNEYIVLLRERGYVQVKKGVITEIRERSAIKYYPKDFPDTICFDKWGCEVGSRNDLIGQLQGMMGMNDPYYF